MNPGNERDFIRLRQSMQWSRTKLEPFRRNRVEALKLYVGRHYSDDGSPDARPINLIELALNIYTRQLVPARPQQVVTTRFHHLMPEAANYQLAMNMQLDRMGFADKLREVVRDAMLGGGFMKIGVTPGAAVEYEDGSIPLGEIFAEPISLDDWVHDMVALRWDNVGYQGNRYLVERERLLESEEFRKAGIKERDLPATSFGRHNEGGGERADAVSRGTDSMSHDFADRVELWDVFIPGASRDGLIVTMLLEDGPNQPLIMREWDGPADGPFRRLEFNDVPANTMPLSPVALMRDQDSLANNMMRKMADQALREKENLTYRSGHESSALNLTNSADAESVKVEDPDSLKIIRQGGINQATFALMMQVKQLFFTMQGNLDALGGLSPQSDTLGQDQLLTESAGRRLEDMRDRTHRFIDQVTRDIGMYVWNDPLGWVDLPKQVPGTKIFIDAEFTPETRAGEFWQYNFKTNMFSRPNTTPSDKVRAIQMVLRELIEPYAEQLREQGGQLDFSAMVDIVAELADLDEIRRIIRFADPPDQTAAMVGERPQRQAPRTTRRYERVGRPGATRQGQDDVMTRMMMGGGVQPSERVVTERPVS